MSQTMENRKTAEEILDITLTDGGVKYNCESGQRLIREPYVLQAMQTFAEQEKEVWSCEFLEWVTNNPYYQYDSKAKLWFGGEFPHVGQAYTTKELYQIFKSERDGK